MAYSDLLIWQYQNKPKALATMRLLERLFAERLRNWAEFPLILDIDTATGKNLDIVGRHIGQARVVNNYTLRKFFGFRNSPLAKSFGKQRQGGGEWYRKRDPLSDSAVLNDEDYRFLLKCRAFKNYQIGTLDNLIDCLRALFSEQANAIDNLNMTVTATIPNANLTEFKRYMINNLDILPRSSGVKIIYQIQ